MPGLSLILDFLFCYPAECQITSLGLAHDIKNDRCKGDDKALSDTEHWTYLSSVTGKKNRHYRGQDVSLAFLILLQEVG